MSKPAKVQSGYSAILAMMPSAQRRALANLGPLRYNGRRGEALEAAKADYHHRFTAEVARIQAEDRQANP